MRANPTPESPWWQCAPGRTCALDPVDTPSGAGPATPERLRDSLSGALERLRAAGIQARVRVGMGEPASEILRVAAEEDVRLVAMTTHGRAGWTRWIYGSVADEVFARCEIPLLAVRTGGQPVTHPDSASE